MAPGPDKQFDVDAALCSAMQLFRSQGFHGVSLSQLTEAMGIGKKSLYDTFGNKRELFLAALRHYADLSLGQVRAVLAEPGPEAGGLERVASLLRYWQQMNSGPCSRGCMLGVVLGDFTAEDAEVSALLVAGLERLTLVIAEPLQEAQAAGELAGDLDVQALARVVIAASQGLSLISRADQDAAFVDSVPNQLIDLLHRLGAASPA